MHQADVKKEALEALAKIGGLLTTEDDVVFTGTKFVIPETVGDLYEAAKLLRARADDEENEQNFSRTFPFKPWDGAAAVARAVKRVFGFSISLPGPWGEPPALMSIPTGVGEESVVPW